MQIKFPLLSIASLAFLLFFGFQGDVELYSWEVGCSITPGEVKVMVDPIWAIWVPQSLVYAISTNALTFGNVMALNEQERETLIGEYLLAHESNHVEQFYALGWWIYLAQYFIDIEPPKGTITDWNDPGQCDRTMWLPPDWWVEQWHFMAIVDDKPL